MKIERLSKAIVGSVCVALAAVGPAWGQAISGEPQTYMKKVGFSVADVATMESGKPVTRIVPEEDDNEAFVLGVIRIKAPAEALVNGIRKIEAFRNGSPTLQIGRFGATPDVSDLKPLVIDGSELEDLRKCRVGDCEIRVGAAAMDLARRVDWNAPDAHARASQLIKEAMAQGVRSYLERGSMAVYNDHDAPESVSAEWEKLLRNSPNLMQYNPEFWRYLLAFPQAPLPGVESFLYWSKDKIRKSVVSVVHVCIQRVEKGESTGYFIAMKHIYDSHYFLANAEFLTLVPDGDAKTGFFLVQCLRARIDPPRQLRGMLLGKIKGAMQDELRELLQEAKSRLEEAAAGKGSSSAPRPEIRVRDESVGRFRVDLRRDR